MTEYHWDIIFTTSLHYLHYFSLDNKPTIFQDRLWHSHKTGYLDIHFCTFLIQWTRLPIRIFHLQHTLQSLMRQDLMMSKLRHNLMMSGWEHEQVSRNNSDIQKSHLIWGFSTPLLIFWIWKLETSICQYLIQIDTKNIQWSDLLHKLIYLIHHFTNWWLLKTSHLFPLRCFED